MPLVVLSWSHSVLAGGRCVIVLTWLSTCFALGWLLMLCCAIVVLGFCRPLCRTSCCVHCMGTASVETTGQSTVASASHRLAAVDLSSLRRAKHADSYLTASHFYCLVFVVLCCAVLCCAVLQLNASYVLWQLWLNALLLLCFALVQWLFLSSDSPLPSPAQLEPASVEYRLARRGLPFFLISNACTGLVNVGIDTMKVGDAMAVCILVAYVHLCVALTLLYDWCRGGGGKQREARPRKTAE